MSRDLGNGVVSSESVGHQGIYSEAEVIEHEQHRLERHAGKVVYEAPAEVEKVAHAKEVRRGVALFFPCFLPFLGRQPKHPTVKPASAALERHAQTLYYKGIEGGEQPDTPKVVQVEMIQPTREQIEEFEVTRTELQREIAPEKLETHQNLFYSPSERQLQVMLDKDFQSAIEGNTVAFCTDPLQALREGFSKSGKLLLCRVAVAPSCRVTNRKLIVKDTRGVQPSFILTIESQVAVNARKN